MFIKKKKKENVDGIEISGNTETPDRENANAESVGNPTVAIPASSAEEENGKSAEDTTTDADASGETESREDVIVPLRFSLQEKLDAWLDQKGLGEDTPEEDRFLLDTLRSAVAMIENAVNENAVDEAIFEVLFRGVNYDRAIAVAAEAGELKGRNARIDELIAEENASDGVPHPGSGNGSFNTNRAPSIFDLARNA